MRSIEWENRMPMLLISRMSFRDVRSSGIRAMLALLLGTTCSLALADEPSAGDKLFALKVAPLLKEKCLGCHGADSTDLKGDYSVLSRESLLRGGESGDAAVAPGKTSEGTLLAAVRGESLEMPPKENDRLTQPQISLLEKWIALGAPWPDVVAQEAIRQAEASLEVTEDGRLVRTSGGTSSEWTNRRYADDDLWAFKPVKKWLFNEQGKVIGDREESNRDPLSASIINSHPTRVIDALIDEKQRESAIAPAPRADARTLIRRAYFDILGFPPSAQEVNAFLAESAKDHDRAWEKLIDQL